MGSKIKNILCGLIIGLILSSCTKETEQNKVGDLSDEVYRLYRDDNDFRHVSHKLRLNEGEKNVLILIDTTLSQLIPFNEGLNNKFKFIKPFGDSPLQKEILLQLKRDLTVQLENLKTKDFKTYEELEWFKYYLIDENSTYYLLNKDKDCLSLQLSLLLIKNTIKFELIYKYTKPVDQSELEGAHSSIKQ